MTIRQNIYFMSLVGGLAGLFCWLAQAFLSDHLTFILSLTGAGTWILVVMYTALMGALISGMCVLFVDHWTGDRVVPLWIAVGGSLGILMGAIAGILTIPIERYVFPINQELGVAVSWTVAGALIGFGTGIRWMGQNKLRAVHSLIGGMVGGAAGGVIFAFAGTLDYAQAASFVIVGAGITLGVTLAPALFRDGMLVFERSSDPRTQKKYGINNTEWILQDGDCLTIGSMGADMSMSVFARAIDIYLPDELVAPRHAMLEAKGHDFYLKVHADVVVDFEGVLPTLRVGDSQVEGERKIRHGDMITIGQSRFRFVTKKTDR